MKTIDVYQGKAVFSIGIFVVQNIPRVIISRDQPMPMQKDGKGHEIFAELALFGFIEFFYAGKGRIGEKTTKEISGVEDSSPVHMHVTDGSSRFNSAALQAHRIPKGVNETIEHGRARIFFDNHRDALIMRGDGRKIRDRPENPLEAISGRNLQDRHNPDERLFSREKNPCVFRFLSRKNRRRNAGKKGKMAGMLFHISGKKDITQ